MMGMMVGCSSSLRSNKQKRIATTCVAGSMDGRTLFRAGSVHTVEAMTLATKHTAERIKTLTADTQRTLSSTCALPYQCPLKPAFISDRTTSGKKDKDKFRTSKKIVLPDPEFAALVNSPTVQHRKLPTSSRIQQLVKPCPTQPYCPGGSLLCKANAPEPVESLRSVSLECDQCPAERNWSDL